MFVLVNLVVPAIVWVTVVAGLILIVRDKVEEDDLVELLSKQQASHREARCDLEGKEVRVGF
jgi:K+-transporting ATPase A subunit